MSSSATLQIDVPQFNFDIIQGQDLTIPITYTIVGITDTMTGATMMMELRSLDYNRLYDTLSLTNSRIVITGVNAFNIIFPNAVTSAYKISVPQLELLHSLEITYTNTKKRLFEGSVFVSRETTI